MKLTSGTNSFMYEPSDTIGVSKYIATRTGLLDATPIATKNTHKKKAKKMQKLDIDIVPLHATRYRP